MGLLALRLFACLAIALSVLVTCAVMAPQTASAVNFLGDACQGAGANSAACQARGESISGSNGIILRAAAMLSLVAGVVAVIMIIIAAIMFITAAGDSNKISNAKKVITYTVVGLVIIFLARVIVAFLVGNV